MACDEQRPVGLGSTNHQDPRLLRSEMNVYPAAMVRMNKTLLRGNDYHENVKESSKLQLFLP